jgi:farnesyl diphosphate synthase
LPEHIGKIGTDILVSNRESNISCQTDAQDNKCSWNVNTALKHATPEQRKILDVSLPFPADLETS